MKHANAAGKPKVLFVGTIASFWDFHRVVVQFVFVNLIVRKSVADVEVNEERHRSPIVRDVTRKNRANHRNKPYE